MQQSSMVVFCDECGLANEPDASHCVACQHPLGGARSVPYTPRQSRLSPLPGCPCSKLCPGRSSCPTSPARLAPHQYPACDFQPGSILAGRYEIQEEVGRGGFSIVYRAIGRKMGFDRCRVAIKRRSTPSFLPAIHIFFAHFCTGRHGIIAQQIHSLIR
jgi:hypothetical protein